MINQQFKSYCTVFIFVRGPFWPDLGPGKYVKDVYT